MTLTLTMIGSSAMTKHDAESRKNVLEAAKNYFFKNFSSPVFIPGQTYIPASAKLLDETDLMALLEASLDLWLTAGRFTKEFEKRDEILHGLIEVSQ